MKEQARTNSQGDAPRRVDSFREWLALWVVGGASVLLVIVAIVSIAYASDKDKTAAQIFGQLLPLVGTWVGTVLAFYFTKESFQTAQKGALETFRQMSPDEEARSIPAVEVMIPANKFDKLTIPEGKTTADITIEEVLKQMKRGRLPVVRADGQLECVIHESTLFEFIKNQASEKVSYDEVIKKTLKDLLEATRVRPGIQMKYGDFFRTTVAYVPSAATLHEARVALSSAPQARDVFVTHGGRPGESLQGWLTDIDIAKRLQR